MLAIAQIRSADRIRIARRRCATVCADPGSLSPTSLCDGRVGRARSRDLPGRGNRRRLGLDAVGALFMMSARNATLVLVNLYWLPLSLQEAALLAIAIPAALLHLAPENHVVVYSVLASLINVISVFLPWPVGALSDRLRGRGTPRQALALLGAALNVIGLILAMSAATVVTFDAAIILATAGAAISTTAYQ